MTTMPKPHHITIEPRPDTVCIRLKDHRPQEEQLRFIENEILDAQADNQTRKVALSLGMNKPVLLFSVFLADLVRINRILGERDSKFLLCEVGDALREVFRRTGLERVFTFVADFDAAEDYEV